MENKQTLEVKDFVYLLLIKLADNSQIMNSKKQKVVSIPSNYKQIIENILCSDNGWKDKFSMLIDTEDYFDDHFFWEKKLAATLKNVLDELDKEYKYNLMTDSIFIEFSEDEIENITKRYKDETINEEMTHFASLLVDFIYTREYQERFCDYSARAVEKMKNLNLAKTEQEIGFDKPKKKVLLP